MGEQVSDRIAGNGHAGGDDRAARIERVLAERLGRAGRGIPKRAGSEPAPLSFVQQALWLTWKLEGGGASTSRPSGLMALEWLQPSK